MDLTCRFIDVVSAWEKVNSLTYELNDIDCSDERYEALVFIFQVKTQSQDAVLFYNTGPSSNKDFVALEISKGKPRLLVDQVHY